jgi:hypothetical protein
MDDKRARQATKQISGPLIFHPGSSDFEHTPASLNNWRVLLRRKPLNLQLTVEAGNLH